MMLMGVLDVVEYKISLGLRPSATVIKRGWIAKIVEALNECTPHLRVRVHADRNSHVSKVLQQREVSYRSGLTCPVREARLLTGRNAQ